MRKAKKLIIIIPFLITIFCVQIVSYSNIKNFSVLEYRNLQKLPILSINSLKSEEYFGSLNVFFSDQFFKRDWWLKEYSKFNLFVLNKNHIRNIVVGKEGYLLPFNKTVNTKFEQSNINKRVSENLISLNKINNFLSEQGKEFIFIGVPHQSTVYSDKYPSGFYNKKDINDYKERMLFDNMSEDIDSINMNKIFSGLEDKSDLYFKTDHHWQINGAFYAYERIIDIISKKNSQVMEAKSREDFNVIKRTGNFNGYFGRQLSFVYPTDDAIEIYQPKESFPKYEKYVDGKLNNRLLLDGNFYEVYMEGNQPEIVIETNRDNLPDVLIVGDSYTNVLEYLLFQHFNTTRILDYRYYDKMNIYDYVDKYNPDIVLFITNDAYYDDNNTFKKLLGDFKK